MGTVKPVKKDDLHQAIDNLSEVHLTKVMEYLTQLQEEAQPEENSVLNMKAYNSLKENYSETLKRLVER